MTDDADILIVGAGAAGLAAARELSSAKLSVIGPDESFAEFLDDYIHRHNLTDAHSVATLYVEGFHAAHADGISVKGLIKTNRAAVEIDDESQFFTRPMNYRRRGDN